VSNPDNEGLKLERLSLLRNEFAIDLLLMRTIMKGKKGNQHNCPTQELGLDIPYKTGNYLKLF